MTRPWVRIVALQLVVWPLALLAVELGYRGWLASRGEAHDAELMRERIARRVEGIDSDPARFAREVDAPPGADHMERGVTHPYWGWSFPNLDERFDRHLERFRGDSIEVVVLGGSVAQGFSREGQDQLIESLGEDPRFEGREVVVLSLAVGGFKQPQQVGILNYALSRGWRPELVVNLDGFNEVALASQNLLDFEVHPLHPAFFIWGPTATSRPPGREHLDLLVAMRSAQTASVELAATIERWSLASSAVLGTWIERRLARHVGDYNRAYEAYALLLDEDAEGRFLKGPAFLPRVPGAGAPPEGSAAWFEAAMRAAVDCWSESSITLRSLCEARGIVYVHALQPTLHDEGSKPLTALELETGKTMESWVRAVHTGYPLLREAGARLRRDGLLFFDGSQAFAGREVDLYYDSCHFNQHGNEILAHALVDFLLPELPADFGPFAD